MTVSQVTEYTGIAPSRTGQTQAQFSNNGDDMNTYYAVIAASMNLSIVSMNLEIIGINNNSISAAASATSASISANFLGKWSDLTGAQSKGAVAHIGELWQLLVDVADITATEPSSSNAQYSSILGEIKAAEIALNETGGSVISSLDTITAIPAYIFAADQQKTYSVPSGAIGKFISGVSTDQLTTSDASTYTLILQKALGVSGQGGDLTQTLEDLQSIIDNSASISGQVFTGEIVYQGGGSISSNAAYGVAALSSNTTGTSNTANGKAALRDSTTGNGNTANGEISLSSNTTGSSNTANGVAALRDNTTGNGNTAIGAVALGTNTTGSGNTGINPMTDALLYSPVFEPTTENNRFCMGSTAVTNAYIQVAWTVVSDARDKTNFAEVPHGLDFVKALKPISYQFRIDRDSEETNGPVRYGFKAQDVLELEGDNPVIVDNEDSERLRMVDTALIPVLVKALQDLDAKFEAYVLAHP